MNVDTDTEALAFADELITDLDLVGTPAYIRELRLAIAARVKKFSADRMMKELMLKVDDDLPPEEA